jgi:hypothetical protein
VTCDRSVVFSIQHYVIKFVSDLWQVGGFLYTTLCNKVCQWLVSGLWFSPLTTIFSTNKTEFHDITEILLNILILTRPVIHWICSLKPNTVLSIILDSLVWILLKNIMKYCYFWGIWVEKLYNMIFIKIRHQIDHFRSDDFNLTKKNPWFSSFLVSSNPLSRKSW